MNLNALLKFMMLHMMNQSENDSHTNAQVKINHSPEIELLNPSPMIEKANNDLDNRNSNEEFRQSYDLTTTLFPTYDCSMPKPPTWDNEKPPIEQSSNMEKETKEIAIKEDINPEESQPMHPKASIRIDLKQQSGDLMSKRLEPESKQKLIGNVENLKPTEVEIIAEPRIKASMKIPLHIVHKLPDAQVLDLMR